MLKLFILTLIALSGGFALQTPETSYRLVEPSIDAYLDAVPGIAAQAHAASIPPYVLPPLIDAEFTGRYSDPLAASFDSLLAAYYALSSGTLNFYSQSPRWNYWLLLNWIEENDIDLDTVDHFEYESYAVTVTPRDFNVDGETDWVLDVRSSSFSQYIIVQRDGASYRRIDAPLLAFDRTLTYWITTSGFMEEQLYDDLNGDGLPEWVLAVGGYGGNGLSGGYLVILNWRDGELVEVSPSHLRNGLWAGDYAMSYDSAAVGGSRGFVFPYGVTIDYDDGDGDGTRDILIHQEQFDNWGCTWTKHRTFSWQGDAYALTRSELVWDDVRGCEIRAAETAMWARDYQAAIPHYGRAFTLPDTGIGLLDQEQRDRYATARLMLAHTLAGRHDDAAAVSASLSVQPDERSALTNFIPAITEHLGDARAMCLAAYDAFTFNCQPDSDSCLGSPIPDLTISMTLENPGNSPNSSRNGFPPASSAGCDPMILLRDDLLAAPLTVDTSPVDQLEARGYAVQSAMHFDLNLDGADEWLIDLTIDRQTIFFQSVPDGNLFDFQFVNVPPPYARAIRSLPDGSAQALVTPHYGGGYCPRVPNGRGGGSTSAAETMALWILDDGILQERQWIPFCEGIRRETLLGDEGQPLPAEFAGWIDLPYPEEELAQAVYRWDSELAEYVATDITSTPPLPESETGSPFSRAVDAMQSGEYDQALILLDQAYQGIQEDMNTTWALDYLRAFTLEMLDRPGEALEGYVAIYESAPPDSAWRTLAGLHLEVNP